MVNKKKPERTCIACRKKQDKEELLRIVAINGEATLDKTQKEGHITELLKPSILQGLGEKQNFSFWELTPKTDVLTTKVWQSQRTMPKSKKEKTGRFFDETKKNCTAFECAYVVLNNSVCDTGRNSVTKRQ